jgi:hypothetical protein
MPDPAERLQKVKLGQSARHIRQWRSAVNASNLAYRSYVVSCTHDCFDGEHRRMIVTVCYEY